MITYKKKITAFIDVLGFSNIVFSSSNVRIDSYYSFLKEKLKKISGFTKIKSYYISDSIVFIADDNLKDFVKLTQLIYFLQASLLEINILARGAITVGEIYLNKRDNIIVGPSLINAYQLEKEAKFPRVLIDRQLIKHYNFNSTNIFLKHLNGSVNLEFEHTKLIKEDLDNLLYVNYLSYLFSRGQSYTSKNRINNLYALIQNNFLNNTYLDKYSWLKNKCIEEINSQLVLNRNLVTNSQSSKARQNLKLRHLPILLDKFTQI